MFSSCNYGHKHHAYKQYSKWDKIVSLHRRMKTSSFLRNLAEVSPKQLLLVFSVRVITMTAATQQCLVLCATPILNFPLSFVKLTITTK